MGEKLRKKTVEMPYDLAIAVLSATGKAQAEVRKQVQKILGLTDGEIKKIETEKMFQEYTNKKIKFNMFDPGLFFKKNQTNKGIVKALYSIGINNKNYSHEDDNISSTKKVRSIRNYGLNYKSWVGEKLLLTGKEIEKLTIEGIDVRSKALLTLAINHVNAYFTDKNMLSEGLATRFQSDKYTEIHATGGEQKSFFDLLKLYKTLSKNRKILIKKGIHKDSEQIRDINMSLFEIQRIFGLATLYNDRERNHEFEKLDQDRIFLREKFGEIFEENNGNGVLNLFHANRDISSAAIECKNTNRKRIYIKKLSNGSYEILEKAPDSYIAEKIFNSGTIVGRTEHFQNKRKNIRVTHIGIRGAKDASSAVDKIIMKGLSSFTEIMDHKGIIIVLDSYSDIDNLEAVLVNELGTRETSWNEPFKVMGKVNNQSSSSYEVKKGIMKLSYKAKDIKQKVADLSKHLATLKEEIDVECDKTNEIKRAIEEIELLIKYLQGRAKKGTYNIEVEIQVFDKENYIKAELDESSPAHHSKYKINQRVFEIFPVLFPISIYGESAIKQFMMPFIKKKYQDNN